MLAVLHSSTVVCYTVRYTIAHSASMDLDVTDS